MENGKILENMTVKIKAGKVVSLGKSSATDMQENGYTSVKAEGLYLCPGLIDCESIRLDHTYRRSHTRHGGPGADCESLAVRYASHVLVLIGFRPARSSPARRPTLR